MVNKDGVELKIEDILVASGTDFISDYIKEEIFLARRKLVDNLSERDKEVVLYRFGFVGRPYTYQEIADRINLSRNSVMRLEDNILQKTRVELQAQGLLEFKEEYAKLSKNNKKSGSTCSKKELIVKGDEKEKSTVELGDKNLKKQVKTIYNFFSDYTKEQVDEALAKLNDSDKKLIMLKYGNDLENPDLSLDLSKKEKARFYSNLIPKMKKMLANPEYKARQRKSKLDETILSEATTLNIKNKELLSEDSKPIEEISKESPQMAMTQAEDLLLDGKQELVNDFNLSTKAVLESSMMKILEQENSLDIGVEATKETYIEILEIFKTARFSSLVSFLSVKEAVVISLKMGYVGDKYFSTKTISDILGISEEEIRQITKKFLLICKEKINQAIDNTIAYTTDQKVFKRQRVEV